MKRNSAIRRLLTILVIAGLALAPLSRPVMAETSSAVSMQPMADDMSGSELTDQMANNMPCCPSKASAPVGCDECVFVAACMSNCFAGILVTVFHSFLVASDRIAVQRDVSRLDGLGYPPAEHPPRTLV